MSKLLQLLLTTGSSFGTKILSFFSKNATKAKELLRNLSAKYGKDFSSSTDLMVYAGTITDSTKKKQFLSNIVAQVALVYSIDEALELISEIAKDEAKVDASLPLSNELKLLIDGASNSLKLLDEISDGQLARADGQKELSLNDSAIAFKAEDEARTTLQRLKAYDVSARAAEIDNMRADLTQLARVLGVSKRSAFDIAMLLKKIDYSYEGVL